MCGRLYGPDGGRARSATQGARKAHRNAMYRVAQQNFPLEDGRDPTRRRARSEPRSAPRGPRRADAPDDVSVSVDVSADAPDDVSADAFVDVTVAGDASVDDRVARLAQGAADLGAVLRTLRLQMQFDLHLREPEPGIGPYMAHVEDVSVRH